MGNGSELALDDVLDTVKPFPKKTFLEFLNNYLQLKRLFVVWKGEFKKITHVRARFRLPFGAELNPSQMQNVHRMDMNRS